MICLDIYLLSSLLYIVLFGWQIIFPPEQREIVNNEINVEQDIAQLNISTDETQNIQNLARKIEF